MQLGIYTHTGRYVGAIICEGLLRVVGCECTAGAVSGHIRCTAHTAATAAVCGNVPIIRCATTSVSPQ